MKNYPQEGTTERARKLRKDPTEAEKSMWRLLRENFPGARFRRQVPIRHFIADFASHRARLVVEIDGGQHAPAVDSGRTAIIETEGYRVLRFWNNEVLANPDGVLTTINRVLAEHHPHPVSRFQLRPGDEAAAHAPIKGEGY